MLFGSTVFMNRTLRGQWITFVFVLKLFISSSSQIETDNVMTFSDDFEGFLKDLGTMVYRSKKTPPKNEMRTRYVMTTPPNKNFRRNQAGDFNTQRAAIGDVLMMKLVSYYEDKYKLAHFDSTTTEGITFVSTLANDNNNKYNLEAVDDDLFERYASRPTVENRRMEPRKVEDEMSEVVIL